MNVDAAVKEIQKLSFEMDASAHNAVIASNRYDAHMTLYNVAVMEGNNKATETERLILHSQLDAILDAGYEIHSRRRRIAEIHRTVTD